MLGTDCIEKILDSKISKNQVVLVLWKLRKIIYSSRDKNRWWSSQVYSRKCLQSNWDNCHSRDSANAIRSGQRFLPPDCVISKFPGNILCEMSGSPSNKNTASESFVFQVRLFHFIGSFEFYFSWMLCFFMFLFGCWPCCFIPFCLKSLKGTLSHFLEFNNCLILLYDVSVNPLELMNPRNQTLIGPINPIQDRLS